MHDQQAPHSLIPHLDQYAGAWAMEETRFLTALQQVRAMDIQLHLQDVKAAGGIAPGRSYAYETTRSGIAILSIGGMMMKHLSSLSTGTSTVMLRNTLRKIRGDADVRGAMLRIDSPGGTVAGTSDLADEIAALAAEKPVHAYAEDLAASAAYWAASQAGEISAGRTALVGSIGTYGVVYDYSGWATKEGIKAYVIRAGEFKGMGTPGTEITEAHRAEMQRVVSSLNEEFLAGVSRGRKLSLDRVRGIADGRVHKAPEAKTLGIIDHVESFDAALSRLEARLGTAAPRRAAVAAAGATTGAAAAAAAPAPASAPPSRYASMSKAEARAELDRRVMEEYKAAIDQEVAEAAALGQTLSRRDAGLRVCRSNPAMSEALKHVFKSDSGV